MTNIFAKTSENNIWEMCGIMATGSRIFTSIIAIYYLTVPDVYIQSVGWIFLIANLSTFIFEVPSGYIADRFGYKKTLIISKSLLIISTLLLIFAENINWLITAAIIASMSVACASGTKSVLMMTTLQDLNKAKDYSKIMGKINGYSLMISLCFSAIAPLLLKISYIAPFFLSLFLDVIGLLLVLSLKNVIFSKKEVKVNKKEELKNAIVSAHNSKFFTISVTTGFIFGTVNGLQIYRGPYQEFTGSDIAMFGIYFAAGRFLASIVMMNGEKIKSYFKDIYDLERFQIIFFSIAFILLAIFDNQYMAIVLLILINAMMWSVFQVRNHFYLDILKDNNYKVTLLSIQNQFVQLFTAVISIGLGYLISVYSYQTSFAILSAYFIIVAGFLYTKAVKTEKTNSKWILN